ncbi:hypothetical protein DV737_g1231, partial [Chaetothyriales sp. CBS 132003]
MCLSSSFKFAEILRRDWRIEVSEKVDFICSGGYIPPHSLTICNNSPDLCSKTYDSVTYLGAHDSPFVRDATTGYSTSGDQFYNTTVQLDSGVRLVTAQVHVSNGDLHLCHTSCDLLDAGLLSDWLGELKQWLDDNPNDVVTVLLVNSDNQESSALHSRFEEANITSYAYTPPSTTSPPAYGSWPTLSSLISANTRLITFIATLPDTPSSAAAYLLNEFTFLFENSFSNTASSDFSCTPDRPSSVQGDTSAALSAHLLPMINHFLYQTELLNIEIPAVDNITTTNSPATSPQGTLGQSAAQCASEYSGRNPSFLLVDFFDQGPAIDVVDSLNGVTQPVGRTAVPSRDSSSGSDGSSRSEITFEGVTELVADVRDGRGKKIKLGAWIWAVGKWSWGGINLSGGDVLS